MPTRRRLTKPRKPVDPGVLHSRVEKAVATLKKSVLTAMRQDLIPKSSPLISQVAALEEALAPAFPRSLGKETEARLPF